MMQMCVAFFHVASVKLCKTVFLYLSETPGWSDKELNDQKPKQEKGQVGWQVGKKKQKSGREEIKEREKKGSATQLDTE